MTQKNEKLLPYRSCVGMMVLNQDGAVWVGRRIRDSSSKTDGITMPWQMPQGGIDAGEEPLEAARRELYEETGIRSVSLLAEAPEWITYDLPEHLIGVALGGRYRGQKQKWFAFRFQGDESEIRIDEPPGGHAPEFDAWAWKPMEELPKLIVPFKRKVYDEIVSIFRPLA